MPQAPKIPTIPDDQSLFSSPLYQIWLKMAREMNPFIKCDGSPADYRAYLQAVEAFASRSIDTGLGVFVTKDISLSVPPPHVHEVLFSYSYEAYGRCCYHLAADLALALQNTNLRWIEAAPFRTLPNAFGLHIPPTAGLTVWGDDEWHPVTDIFVERMTDPSRIAFAHETFPNCPADCQFFSWEAVSRAKIHEGLLYRNWGLFPIGEDMRLDTMMKGLEEWGTHTAARANELPDAAANATARQGDPGSIELADYTEWTTREFLKDTKAHFTEHTIGCLACVGFIARWVLFTSTDAFEKAVSRRMPPGFKAAPKASKKAKAIQDKVLKAWGKQFRVVLPPAEEPAMDEPEETMAAVPGTGTHASPVRHMVEGFFRQQPYGPGRSFRKTKWIQPFWRGLFMGQRTTTIEQNHP